MFKDNTEKPVKQLIHFGKFYIVIPPLSLILVTLTIAFGEYIDIPPSIIQSLTGISILSLFLLIILIQYTVISNDFSVKNNPTVKDAEKILLITTVALLPVLLLPYRASELGSINQQTALYFTAIGLTYSFTTGYLIGYLEKQSVLFGLFTSSLIGSSSTTIYWLLLIA